MTLNNAMIADDIIIRSLATSVVLCAAGVGTFLVAPLAQTMLDIWGWRGAMRGLAALAGVSVTIITH